MNESIKVLPRERRIECCSDSPVESVGLLVAVIEGVVVSLPEVVIEVDVVGVHIVSHVQVSVPVLQLGVVVVRDRGEWVEKIGVNGDILDHFVLLSLGVLLIHTSLEGEDDLGDEKTGSGVEQEVGAVVKTSQSTQSVSSHITFSN